MTTPADTPTLEQMSDALTSATKALESANARIADLEAKQAAAEEANPTPSATVTHYLHLASGQVVEQDGAIPTHIDQGENGKSQRVPVIAAYVKE